jgi:anti-sigma regulatory factor (Ser/Thr protein kinase)
LELRQDCLLLRVSDEGPGFDWQVLAQQEMAAGDQVHGRGLWLYFRYADRVEFNSCGNRVTFIRCLNHPDPSPAASCQAGS